MSISVAFVDVLNAREQATILWGVVLVTVAAARADGFIPAVGSVLRAMLSPKLVLLFAITALYCAALTLAAKGAGLWHTATTKETLYWFFGVALVLVGDALMKEPDWKRLLRRGLGFTILIEFLVNLYVFPLAAELVVVPVVFILVAMQAIADRKTPTGHVIDRSLMVAGLVLLIYASASAATDGNTFLTRENAEAFLVSPAFTLALIPYLYAVAQFSRWEQSRIRRAWSAAHQS